MQKSVDLLTWIRCSCKNSCLENIRIAFIYDNGAEVRISSFWQQNWIDDLDGFGLCQHFRNVPQDSVMSHDLQPNNSIYWGSAFLEWYKISDVFLLLQRQCASLHACFHGKGVCQKWELDLLLQQTVHKNIKNIKLPSCGQEDDCPFPQLQDVRHFPLPKCPTDGTFEASNAWKLWKLMKKARSRVAIRPSVGQWTGTKTDPGYFFR